MEALDGNAIGGLLAEVFGAEMTATTGTCASCGSSWPVGELVVYLRGPGIVARCRGCGSVVMVLVTVRGITCVDLLGISRLEHSR